jgi:hypothetical protein
VSRNDKSVSPIVPFATYDDDLANDAQLAKLVGTTAAGVFHQDKAFHSIVVDCLAVDAADLLAGEGWKLHVLILADTLASLLISGG